jgi:hypothetical protein
MIRNYNWGFTMTRMCIGCFIPSFRRPYTRIGWIFQDPEDILQVLWYQSSGSTVQISAQSELRSSREFVEGNALLEGMELVNSTTPPPS